MAFHNREEYEAWKANRTSSSGHPSPTPDSPDETLPAEAGLNQPGFGLKSALYGVGATCLAAILSQAGYGLSVFLTFMGPFLIVLGCGAMVHEFRYARSLKSISLSDSLWYLAGTGAGALNVYRTGILGAAAHARGLGSGGYLVIIIFGVVFLSAFVHSLFAKALSADQKDFTQSVIALACSALTVSVLFFAAGDWADHPLQRTSLLLGSWASWGASVFMALTSYFARRFTGAFNWLTRALHTIGATLLLGGAILLAIFAYFNIALK